MHVLLGFRVSLISLILITSDFVIFGTVLLGSINKIFIIYFSALLIFILIILMPITNSKLNKVIDN